MEPAATSTRDRTAYLSDLSSPLRHLSAFFSEDEPMRSSVQLQHLHHHQEEEEELEQLEGSKVRAAHSTSVLTIIANPNNKVPDVTEDRSSHHQLSSADTLMGEFRLIVEDSGDQRVLDVLPPRRGSIPIMENEIEDSGRISWYQMPRLVRATSGRFFRAPARSGTRDRRRSLPLTRAFLSNSDTAVREDRNGGGETSLSVAASSHPSSTGVEEAVEGETLGMHGRQKSDSQGHLVPTLLRSMASYLGLSMEETFLCQICYEYAPMNTSFALSVCGHTFCETCLKQYLEFNVNEGQVYPKCFYEDSEDKTTCKAEILADDIQALVSSKVWQKHGKFKFNKDHELARQCPYCDHSQLCAGRDQPECICEACNRGFCFVHSSAHQGRTCAEYDKKMIAVEKLNNALISEISKQCPGCQNNVEKTGGCNQMKCVICNVSFCWICLEVIDDSVFPEHFQWWNVRGCAGNQMVDTEGRGATHKGVGVVMRMLFFVLFGPPAFVLAVVFCIICCCFFPCTVSARLTFRQAFTTCFCVSGYVLLAPIVLALGLIALGVFIGGVASGAAVLVCMSPVVGLVLLFRRDALRPTSDRRLSYRRSSHAESGRASVNDNTHGHSPTDQTTFRLSMSDSA
uniref:RBR-type E3 ubiquitin transferase n=1 Tax=Hyaloperonospora arabidopsidis (strain Emoy2) TaxID=559515 RepID=M4BNV2_HYAAE